MRSPHDAERDLPTCAGAGDPVGCAHVLVGRDDGESVETTGLVTAEVDESAPIKVCVDGVFSFAFDVRSCRGAWLFTFDDADYYTLKIDLGWGCVELSDAYNGL